MKQLFLALGLIASSVFQAGMAADKAADKAADAAKNPVVPAAPSPRVQVFTSMGNFIIELNAERAPLTVPHFLRYVDQGQYTNSIFHRVIASFLIQGGGYDTHYGLKGTPYKVFNESGNGLPPNRTAPTRSSMSISTTTRRSIRINRAGVTRCSERSSRAWKWWTRSATCPPARWARSRKMLRSNRW